MAGDADLPVVAYDLSMEWVDGRYWIVERAVHADGSRTEEWRYRAYDLQITNLRYWSSWPPGSNSGPDERSGGDGA